MQNIYLKLFPSLYSHRVRMIGLAGNEWILTGIDA